MCIKGTVHPTLSVQFDFIYHPVQVAKSKMGYLTLVLTSFTFLLAYAFLFNGAHAKLMSPADASSPSQMPNELQKRPTYLKGFPIRRLKPLALYRRDFQAPDVEFMDDAVNDIEKRFDDYGHMRWVAH